MIENNFTPTPNIIFDCLLKELSYSELKIILVIIRQTIGWVDIKTGKRKEKDWISLSQFVEKTGLSRKSISKAIGSLSIKNLIVVVDKSGKSLNISHQRKGHTIIYYSFHLENPREERFTYNLCKKFPKHVQKVTYNKRNLTKEIHSDYVRIKDVIELKKSELDSKLKHNDDSSEFGNSDESKELS